MLFALLEKADRDAWLSGTMLRAYRLQRVLADDQARWPK
jgi:hypothetical protein